MHIKNYLCNYLYDKNEYTIWLENQVYVYGVKNIKTFNDKIIILQLASSNLTIKGSNLKITKSTEKEIMIDGEINEIIK